MIGKQRRIEPGYVYHVLNRGAERQPLFFSDADYEKFESLMEETLRTIPLEIFTYELMPNHWHFVVRPASKKQLSDFFQYVSATHAKRFRVACNSIGFGHVYQDRFKSFAVQGDGHYLTLCRYVERNALRAGLVQRAEQWRWSGLWRRISGRDAWLTSDWPVPRPADWLDWVNAPLTDAELESLRRCIRRGSPYGGGEWAGVAADVLGLAHTLRPIGRPPTAARGGK